MLTSAQLQEIREHLDRAQNPVFLYDNDADGFCSYVLLRRLLGRGKGVILRSHPEIDIGYAQKALQLNADYVFVLDKPFLGQEFLDELAHSRIPVVWIDHHAVQHAEYTYDLLYTYNSSLTTHGKVAPPVTHTAYLLNGKPEDQWIALVGCLSDRYLPEWAKDFGHAYPSFWGKAQEAFEAYYSTGIGTIARALSFGLKDSLRNVVYLQNFFIACASPEAAQAELESESSFARKYRELRNAYDGLLSEALTYAEKDILFFSYGGKTSMSSDLANELCFRHPPLLVVVAYKNGAISNISVRGKRAKEIVEKLIPDFEGASGGGHPEAVGLRLRTADLERFKEELKKALTKRA